MAHINSPKMTFPRSWPFALAAACLLAGCQSDNNTGKRTAPAPAPVAVTVPAPAAPQSAAAPAVPRERKVIRIKAGSADSFTDSSGNVWLPDQGFADGDTVDRAADLPISNTKDPALYRSERYSMSAFSYQLPNGNYTVKLHFAETFEDINAPGLRVFSFKVQGREFNDFDVFAKAGGAQKAYIEIVPIEVTNGKLEIGFASKAENPEINGIEIFPEP